VTQSDLLRKVKEVLDGIGVAYMVVGSHGSTAWGEARFTQDIDVVADLQDRHAEPLAEAFPPGEYYVSIDAVRGAIRRRGQFNVIHPGSGNKIDFIASRLDAWGRVQLDRRRTVILPDGLTVPVAAPEDVVLGKLVYYQEGGSDKHLRDIAGILKVSGDDLDMDYLAEWAGQLGLTDIWQEVLRRFDSPRQ